MTISRAQVPTHWGHVFCEVFRLHVVSFKSIVGSSLCFSDIWFSPKVKYRFVDFFEMVSSALSQVNLKYIN